MATPEDQGNPAFVDTNVFFYSLDSDNPVKRKRTEVLLQRACRE